MQKAAELRELRVKRAVRRAVVEKPNRLVQFLIGQKARVHPPPVILEVIRRGQHRPGLLVQRRGNIADFGAVIVALDPRCIDCDRHHIVHGQGVGFGLYFQGPVAPNGAAVFVLPVRVQLLQVFHRGVENLRCFFQRLCIIAERHAVRGPCDLFLRLRLMRSAERVVRHRAVCTVPPIVKRHLIIHRHRRRGRRGRGGRRLRGRLCRGCGRFRRHGGCRHAVRRGGGAGGEQKGKRGKNYSVLFHDTHLLLKAPVGADACIGPQALP